MVGSIKVVGSCHEMSRISQKMRVWLPTWVAVWLSFSRWKNQILPSHYGRHDNRPFKCLSTCKVPSSSPSNTSHSCRVLERETKGEREKISQFSTCTHDSKYPIHNCIRFLNNTGYIYLVQLGLTRLSYILKLWISILLNIKYLFYH